MKCSQEIKESPESTVVPYEDIDTKQVHISGEKFPGVILGMCDNCHWCYTAVKDKGIINSCPVCNNPWISKIPINIDEVCIIEVDNTRGVTLKFDRRLPLR